MAQSGISSGFNATQINNSLKKLQESYNDLYNALHKQVQTRFIDYVATGWACQAAQTFFENAKNILNDLLREVTSTYGTVTDSIVLAAKTWARDTEASFVPESFAANPSRLNRDSIRENIDGVRGADKSVLEGAKTALQEINRAVDSALDKSVDAIRNSGFSDEQQAQQQALEGSIRSIKQKLDSSLATILNGFTNEINKTIQDYGAIVSTNASNFSSIK